MIPLIAEGSKPHQRLCRSFSKIRPVTRLVAQQPPVSANSSLAQSYCQLRAADARMAIDSGTPRGHAPQNFRHHQPVRARCKSIRHEGLESRPYFGSEEPERFSHKPSFPRLAGRPVLTWEGVFLLSLRYRVYPGAHNINLFLIRRRGGGRLETGCLTWVFSCRLRLILIEIC